MVIYFFLLLVDSLIFTCLSTFIIFDILSLFHALHSLACFPLLLAKPALSSSSHGPSVLKMSGEMGNFKSRVCTYLTKKDL